MGHSAFRRDTLIRGGGGHSVPISHALTTSGGSQYSMLRYHEFDTSAMLVQYLGLLLVTVSQLYVLYIILYMSLHVLHACDCLTCAQRSRAVGRVDSCLTLGLVFRFLKHNDRAIIGGPFICFCGWGVWQDVSNLVQGRARHSEFEVLSSCV